MKRITAFLIIFNILFISISISQIKLNYKYKDLIIVSKLNSYQTTTGYKVKYTQIIEITDKQKEKEKEKEKYEDEEVEEDNKISTIKLIGFWILTLGIGIPATCVFLTQFKKKKYDGR